jgi:molybdopterin-guanine dinucleotide biosynthesis protein
MLNLHSTGGPGKTTLAQLIVRILAAAGATVVALAAVAA